MIADNPLFELQQTIYNSRNYTRRRLHRERHAWVSDAISRFAGQAPSGRAIEYGPGSGIYLPVIARQFSDVTAADVEVAYLSGVRLMVERVPGLRLITDDITRSDLTDGAFGFVLCSEVLEHVPCPEAALKTIHRILQPGGIAVVTTPQRHSLMEMSCRVAFLPGVIHLVRSIYREPVLETGHISLRTSAAFRKAIDDAGFTVLEAEKLGLYVPLLAEFGGELGGRGIAALERAIHQTPLDWMLWTQAYVLKKPLA